MELGEYTRRVRLCNDKNTLNEIFKVGSNYPILFYGEAIKIFDTLVTDFRETPSDNGLVSRWEESGDYISEGNILFNYGPGTTSLAIKPRTQGHWTMNGENQIGGEHHSLALFFLPMQERLVDGTTHWHQGTAQAIAEVCDYIIKKGFKVRCPSEGLNINHIPN